MALRANGKYDEAAAQLTITLTSGTNRTLAARAETEAKNAAGSKELAAIKNSTKCSPWTTQLRRRTLAPP